MITRRAGKAASNLAHNFRWYLRIAQIAGWFALHGPIPLIHVPLT
jgi:hypothetical protein